ncbi:MAG: Unknown protein [uncultured Sulfurovum sp.]|uniref:Replication protein n=1 Tax=uncultured Sulfurovum sp. TaxID=269237 RepID=A0A6S6UCG5_9BACT|nr:MAG: Unknown protein [uncultured Sulfurovum sp.]
MSKNPQNLPKRTRVLVKDILFQEKYKLTHTQVDIMAYIINALTWSTKVGAFFPVTNKKFHEDLPQISEKTLEESLRVLKAMELIEVQMITVPKWNNAYVRGIAVLPKGLEYNARYYQAKEQTVIDNLNEQVLTKDQEIRELKEQLKHLEATETTTKIVEEATEKDEGSCYDDLEFTSLVKTVTKAFGATSEPICNGVKGWKKETQFYINSYNKLTILSPTGEVAQLKSPIEIGDFWKYLSKNRHQIGKVIDFTKKLDIEELNHRYVKMNIVLKENKFKVHKIEKLKDGVQVLIQSSDTNKISVLSKHGKVIVFGLEECEKVLLGLRR